MGGCGTGYGAVLHVLEIILFTRKGCANMIALANDHAGVGLKLAIAKYLEDAGLAYTDFGTHSNESCDYPVYALKAASAVASGEHEKGILICGTGVGIGMAAGKVKGIRCVVCSEPYSARLSREHTNSNMLCLGARVVGEGLALMIVREWLAASFKGGRHALRLEQVARIEEGWHIDFPPPG